MFYVNIFVQKRFSSTVYQERLVFYYFKNNTKRYPKLGECIFNNEKLKSFQGLNGGPGSQPVWDYSIHRTPQCSNDQKILRSPLTKSWVAPGVNMLMRSKYVLDTRELFFV